MVTQRSLRGLDVVNFLITDVKDGVGVYLCVYLLNVRNWDPSEIGIAISLPGFIGIVLQPLAGAWIDTTKYKRAMIIIASSIIGVCCLAIVAFYSDYVVLITQSVLGIVQSIFSPAIAAISLGLVGHRMLPYRIGRNESFNHLGNMFAAVVSGFLGWYISYDAIFIFSFLQCTAIILATLIIRENEIDHQLARSAVVTNERVWRISSIKSLLSDIYVLRFTASMLFFHLANAAMLPLLGQKIGVKNPDNSSFYLSVCIIIAQAVMVPVAVLAGKKAENGRKKVMILAFIILPLRAFFLGLINNPYLLTALQLFDGISAGIFGVISILMIADLSKGTGHFNLLQGVVYSVMGLGIALSSFITGFVVTLYGYNTGFYFLSITGTFALLFFLFFVNETKVSETDNKTFQPS